MSVRRFLLALLCTALFSACAHDPEPVRAGPDYDAVRERARESHQSLKHDEAQQPSEKN